MIDGNGAVFAYNLYLRCVLTFVCVFFFYYKTLKPSVVNIKTLIILYAPQDNTHTVCDVKNMKTTMT